MKKFILVMALISVTGPSAFAKCTKGMKTILTCTIDPQPGDHEVMSDIADRVEICTKGASTYMAVEADGKGPSPEIVIVTPRTGATSYDMGPFSMSVGTRPYPDNVRFGKLYAQLGAEHLSVTLKCKRSAKYYRGDY